MDTKENFDVTAMTQLQLGGLAINTSALSLIESAQRVVKLLEPQILELGQVIENSGVEGFAKVASASLGNYFLRFLHYPPMPENAVLGEPHTDHSGLTFHLHESTDGCEQLTPKDKHWEPLLIAEGKMLAFGGM